MREHHVSHVTPATDLFLTREGQAHEVNGEPDWLPTVFMGRANVGEADV